MFFASIRVMNLNKKVHSILTVKIWKVLDLKLLILSLEVILSKLNGELKHMWINANPLDLTTQGLFHSSGRWWIIVCHKKR